MSDLLVQRAGCTPHRWAEPQALTGGPCRGTRGGAVPCGVQPGGRGLCLPRKRLRRGAQLPPGWAPGSHMPLHFDDVDQDTSVWLTGMPLSSRRGDCGAACAFGTRSLLTFWGDLAAARQQLGCKLMLPNCTCDAAYRSYIQQMSDDHVAACSPNPGPDRMFCLAPAPCWSSLLV